ncbi:touch receptor neuron protein Mec-17-domain-containing protein [Ochromonadaceae sp. CCMP2298]|nr:touch receptor neuron protein Mec-17-domain-containing protein [Ochromonadaceae sp. CCMP2298]
MSGGGRLLHVDRESLGALTKLCPTFPEQFDRLGVESGEAQMLSTPISSVQKLTAAAGQGAVLYCTGEGAAMEVLGFTKYGQKDLYFYKGAKLVECPGTSCLLDFYVSGQQQRRGVGLAMFSEALRVMCVTAAQLAYDRPSPKLTSFLQRHYSLGGGDLQPNRFMVFREGFRALL